jgi:membrane protease YdiL (CAAX protease family)
MENLYNNAADFSWVAIGVSITTLLFFLYQFVTDSKGYWLRIKKWFGAERGPVARVIVRRLWGALLFGLVPLILILFCHPKPLAAFGLTLDNGLFSLGWIAALTPVVLLMNYVNAKKSDNLAMYPQIRKTEWSRSLLVGSALSWMAYLTGYEFLFRGFLLFSSYFVLDAPTAIAINVCLYALVHLPKGIKETLGAIPLGILLGILTLQSNSLLIALAVHIIMALTNEWFSIRANPEIKMKAR